MTLRIGSRSSQLALAQSRLVAEKLHSFGEPTEIVIIQSKGDHILDLPLHKVGDKGLFTQQLEQALLSEKIDLAVHSLKDLPTENPSDLQLSAILPRSNPFDCVVFHPQYHGLTSLTQLPANSLIGTSSLRRVSQLSSAHNHLRFVDLRGNIQTRLDKLEKQNLAAIILAVAGLERLDLQNRISYIFEPEICLPCPGQGAIAVQSKATRTKLNQTLSELSDHEAEFLTRIERTLLNVVMGGCQVPLGAYAKRVSEDQIELIACVEADGQLHRARKHASSTDILAVAQDIGLKFKALLSLKN